MLDSSIVNAQGNNSLLLPLVFGDDTLFEVLAGSLMVGGPIDNGGHLLTVNSSASTAVTFNGAISGSGGLVKNGSGTLVLAGANGEVSSASVLGGVLEVTSASALADGSPFVGG